MDFNFDAPKYHSFFRKTKKSKKFDLDRDSVHDQWFINNLNLQKQKQKSTSISRQSEMQLKKDAHDQQQLTQTKDFVKSADLSYSQIKILTGNDLSLSKGRKQLELNKQEENKENEENQNNKENQENEEKSKEVFFNDETKQQTASLSQRQIVGPIKRQSLGKFEKKQKLTQIQQKTSQIVKGIQKKNKSKDTNRPKSIPNIAMKKSVLNNIPNIRRNPVKILKSQFSTENIKVIPQKTNKAIKASSTRSLSLTNNHMKKNNHIRKKTRNPPCIYPMRVQRQWEEQNGKNWYDLCDEQMKLAEEQMKRKMRAEKKFKVNITRPKTTRIITRSKSNKECFKR